MRTAVPIPFFKYEGLGNDFIVVDVRGDAARADAARQAVEHLCDRHFGIGADGVLLVEDASDAKWAMRVINADGSIPEMCGNGLRCVAQWLLDEGIAEASPPFLIDTDAGPHRISLHDGLIEVQMAAPDFGAVAPSGPLIEADISAAGRTFRATAVSMGNPHLVLFDTPPDPDTVARYGMPLCTHPLFEHQVNVAFCAEKPEGGLRVTVHERGAGVTLACGTGACAAAAAHVKAGRLPANVALPVSLPGGDLFITVPADGGRILMRGPARRVFSGHVS